MKTPALPFRGHTVTTNRCVFKTSLPARFVDDFSSGYLSRDGGALLIGYWALRTLFPIRDIPLTKHSLATLTAKADDTKTDTLFEEEGN